jgi:hypothetical protein
VKYVLKHGLQRAGQHLPRQIGIALAGYLNQPDPPPPSPHPPENVKLLQDRVDLQIADRVLVGRLIDILLEGSSLPWSSLKQPDSAAYFDFWQDFFPYKDKWDAFFEHVHFQPEFFQHTGAELFDSGYFGDYPNLLITRNGNQLGAEARSAFVDALNLASAGLIHRLRRCRQCTRWFYARVEDHFCCSAQCRERHFRTTPEGKEKRKKYMQRYRAQPSSIQGKRQRTKKSKGEKK